MKTFSYTGPVSNGISSLCRRRFKTRFFAGAKLDRFQREMSERVRGQELILDFCSFQIGRVGSP